MTIEIIDGPLLVEKPAKARYRTAHADGQHFRVRVIDAESPTFGADFEAAFKANVRRIRRQERVVKAAG